MLTEVGISIAELGSSFETPLSPDALPAGIEVSLIIDIVVLVCVEVWVSQTI